MADDLAVALDPFARIETTVLVIRYGPPPPTRDPVQPVPWGDVFFIGGEPADHALALVLLAPQLRAQPPPPGAWTGAGDREPVAVRGADTGAVREAELEA